MKKHARETIRRPREFETDFEWDDEKKMESKESHASDDNDLDDNDRYKSDEDEDI